VLAVGTIPVDGAQRIARGTLLGAALGKKLAQQRRSRLGRTD
jgi:hypothetical protein